jgi:hypothetical protein
MPLRVLYENVCMNLRHVMSLMQVGKIYLSVTILRIMHSYVDYIVSELSGYQHI